MDYQRLLELELLVNSSSSKANLLKEVPPTEDT